VLTRVSGGKKSVKELFGRLNPRRAGVKWYAVAILLNPIVVTVVLLVLAATISPDFEPAILKNPTLMVALPFALFIGLTAGTLEEFGWTGFALPRLLDRYKAFSAAIMLGIIWALWHVPLIVWVWPAVRSSNAALLIGGGLIWCAALIPYRILMSWVYVNTDASLLQRHHHACLLRRHPGGPAPGDPRSGRDRAVLRRAQRGAVDRRGRRGGPLRGEESDAGKWSNATHCCPQARSIASALSPSASFARPLKRAPCLAWLRWR
jgi:membrane protease YdiL (CAAX protease family)